MRLLQPNKIAKHIWDAQDNCIHFSPDIISAYISTINKAHLWEVAISSSDDDGPVGGISDEDTKKHFAQRFLTSLGRMQLALLDPHRQLDDISNILIKKFSGGELSILDIPSGAGASSLAILSTVAELRKSKILPCHRLCVHITCGDISSLAHCYFDQQMTELKDILLSVNIQIILNYESWDITDPNSTTQLLHSWITQDNFSNKLIYIANFSGFLLNDGKVKDHKERIGEIFRWGNASNAPIIWIEPHTNAAKGLFNSIIKHIKKLFCLFASSSSPLSYVETESKYANPIKKCNVNVRARIAKIRGE